MHLCLKWIPTVSSKCVFVCFKQYTSVTKVLTTIPNFVNFVLWQRPSGDGKVFKGSQRTSTLRKSSTRWAAQYDMKQGIYTAAITSVPFNAAL